jgi:peroxiredoxin
MTPGPLAVGDPAPDASVVDVDGRRRSLSEAWSERPAVLGFLRYFGCPFCQAFVGRLHAARDRIDELGAGVTLVGQGSRGAASAFAAPRGLRFDVRIDTDRSAFRAFGLGDASITQIVSPSAGVAWIRTQASGEARQGGLHGGSFRQMPGTFVVDAAGTVRFAQGYRHVADDPSVPAVLALLEGLPRPG